MKLKLDQGLPLGEAGNAVTGATERGARLMLLVSCPALEGQRAFHPAQPWRRAWGLLHPLLLWGPLARGLHDARKRKLPLSGCSWLGIWAPPGELEGDGGLLTSPGRMQWFGPDK